MDLLWAAAYLLPGLPRLGKAILGQFEHELLGQKRTVARWRVWRGQMASQSIRRGGKIRVGEDGMFIHTFLGKNEKLQQTLDAK